MWGHKLYCVNCGTIAIPVNFTKGSFFMEVILWLFFIVPGLIYSVWRLASRYKACPACKSPNMVPLNSPRARADLSSHGR